MAECLVASSDPALGARIARGLGAGFDAVRAVGVGADLLDALRPDDAPAPRVVLVVADDPDGAAGPAGTGEWLVTLDLLAAAAPHLPVLVVGPPDPGRGAERRAAALALEHGAQGFLRAGDGVGPERVLAGAATVDTELSTRERDVLLGMTEGLGNAEIAAELGIAEDTVKTLVRRMFRKLGAGDRADAVARGFRQGLLR